MMPRAAQTLVWTITFSMSAVPLSAQRVERSGVDAFAIEAAGGIAGSLAGVGIAVALAERNACENDNLECILSQVFVAGVAGTVGATVGTVIAGRAADTRPSIGGALAGAVVGAVAGVGVLHLVTEEASLNVGRARGLVIFSLTQGIITAIGSRIGSGF